VKAEFAQVFAVAVDVIGHDFACDDRFYPIAKATVRNQWVRGVHGFSSLRLSGTLQKFSLGVPAMNKIAGTG
jgi:hypothetical protein